MLSSTKRSVGFRPLVEQLEDRCLLAGGLSPVPTSSFAIPEPFIKVIESPVQGPSIQPNSSDQTIAQVTIASANSRSFENLGEMIFVPSGNAFVSNAINFKLEADLTGNPKIMSVIANATPDPTTGLLDFIDYQPVWIRPGQNLLVQVDANISFSPASGPIGADLAVAGFYDLHNNQVPDGNVTYLGNSSVRNVLPMELEVSENWMPARATTIIAGAKNVEVFDSYIWSNGATVGTETFVATQGSLLNATNYSLQIDSNYDGVADITVRGVVSGGKLTFILPKGSQGTEKVFADVAVNPVAGNPYLQLGFSTTTPVTGKDAATGRPLQGSIITNGIGVGQMAVFSYPTSATIFTVCKNPEVIVNEIAMDGISTPPKAGDAVVLDKFDVAAAISSDVISHASINALYGDFGSMGNITLWAGTDSSSMAQVAIGQLINVGSMARVSFDSFYLTLPVGTALHFEVRAMVANNPVGILEAELDGIGAIGFKHSDGSSLDPSAIWTNFVGGPLYNFSGSALG